MHATMSARMLEEGDGAALGDDDGAADGAALGEEDGAALGVDDGAAERESSPSARRHLVEHVGPRVVLRARVHERALVERRERVVAVEEAEHGSLLRRDAEHLAAKGELRLAAREVVVEVDQERQPRVAPAVVEVLDERAVCIEAAARPAAVLVPAEDVVLAVAIEPPSPVEARHGAQGEVDAVARLQVDRRRQQALRPCEDRVVQRVVDDPRDVGVPSDGFDRGGATRAQRRGRVRRVAHSLAHLYDLIALVVAQHVVEHEDALGEIAPSHAAGALGAQRHGAGLRREDGEVALHGPGLARDDPERLLRLAGSCGRACELHGMMVTIGGQP